MLVLSRRTSEKVILELEDGRTIEIMPVQIGGDKVRLGLTGPRTIKIHRDEIWHQILAERSEAQTPAA